MKFLVHPPNRETVRLVRTGPGGKGFLSVAYPVRKRWVEIPDATCSVFAECIGKMIDAKTLIVPVHGDDPKPVVPGPAPLKCKAAALPAAPTPEPDVAEVEITEAEIEDAPAPRGRRRNY